VKAKGAATRSLLLLDRNLGLINKAWRFGLC
jgi:hypothetical protein